MKKQEQLYAIHPILHELQVNEDGTDIIWQGKKVKVNKYKRKHDSFPVYKVHIKNRTIPVAKLVCEAWHGMGEIDQVARHKGSVEDHHFTNLYWDKKGFNKLGHKRSKLSKIKDKDVSVILQRIEQGDTFAAIATDYNTTGMSIYRLKKRHEDDESR